MRHLTKLFLLSGLLFSCEESIRDTQTETKSSEAFSQSMSINNIVFSEGFGVIANNTQMSGWQEAWPNDSIWDSIHILNAGSVYRAEVYYDSATDDKGNLLNGKLVIETYLPLFSNGSEVTMVVDDLSLNGIDLGGTHEFEKSNTSTDYWVEYQTYNLVYNNHDQAYATKVNSTLEFEGEIIFTENNQSLTWSYYPGIGNGLNSRGAAYSFTVLNAIEGSQDCAFLRTGEVAVQPSEFTTRKIDYKDACSNTFNVRIDSNWVEVSI